MLAPLHQPPPGLLAPPVRDDLRAPGVSAWFVVEITWRSGLQRYARVDLATEEGLYLGILRSTGTYTYAVSDRSFRLEGDSPSIEVEDLEFEIKDRIQEGGAYGAAVKTRLAVKGRPASSWPVIFVGVLREWEQVRPLVWRLNFSHDDVALESNVPRALLPPYDFPHAAPEARNEATRLAYGVHSSIGVGDQGIIPLPLIDRTRPDYLVSRGTCIVTAEYADGKDVTPLSGSVEYPRPSGRFYTVVEGDELSPPVAVGSEARITADIVGLLTSPTSAIGASVIKDPADQLLHLADNWVWAEYGSQKDWFTGTSPVHLGWLDVARQFLAARGYRASRLITHRIRAREVFEEWCRNHQVHVFRTMAGRLALRPEDDTITNLYDLPWIAWHDREMGDLSIEFQTVDLVREITARYLWHEAAAAFQFALTVVDPSVPFPTAEDLDLHWSESAVS